MITYISIYEFYKPASVSIFLDNLINLIEFRILSPEPLIQIWVEDFSFKKMIKNGWL